MRDGGQTSVMHPIDILNLSESQAMFDDLPAQAFRMDIQPQTGFERVPIMLQQCVCDDFFLVLLHQGTEAALVGRHWKSPGQSCAV